MRFFARHPSDTEARSSFGPHTSLSSRHPGNPPPPTSMPAPTNPFSTIPFQPSSPHHSNTTNPQASPSSQPQSSSTSPPNMPANPAKLAEFLEKYDPRPNELPALYPMTEHRAMMRTMFLDNILWNTARLHKHNWILLSGNERYKELCTPERWKAIQEDLESYTKAVQTYEYWLASFIQTLELDPVALPPTYSTYGKTLAILECASHPSHHDPSEAPFLQGLAEGLTLSHAKWSCNNAYFRHLREVQKVKHEKRKGLWSRVVMAVFGGATLIVPMLIMVLDQRRITTLLTTSFCTLGIGLILAFWMDDANNKDIIAATAAYAAVLVVFVGSGNGF